MRLKDLIKSGVQGSDPPQKGSERPAGASEPLPPETRLAARHGDPMPQQADSAQPSSRGPEQAPRSFTSPNSNAYAELRAAKEAFDQGVAIMEEVFQSVGAPASVSIASVEETVAVLFQNLEISDALLAPFFGADGRSLNIAKATVNVCILSVKIGMQLNYSRDELHKLGLAALLHDVGMARLPKALLDTSSPLSGAERAALRRCPEEGAELIRNLGASYAQLAEVVLQVHERTDGSGYPGALRGDQIHPHAQIVGVADVYESLVHHRAFRQRFWPPQALTEILQRERTSFPDRILKALIRVLATLPIGVLVRLNSGEIGRVVAKNQDFPLRPVVEILVRRGKQLPKPQLIDLSQNALLHVEEFVTEEALAPGAAEDQP